MEVQVSVTSTSAPSVAPGSSVTVTEPPVSTARAPASSTTAASGVKPVGAAIRTCMPAVAPPSSSDWAMLLAPSPR